MLLGVLGDDEFVALFNMVLVTLNLIDKLIVGEESQRFCGLAEVTLDNRTKAFEVDPIDDVEVVVLIVSDLIDGILADNHQVLQLLIIVATDHLLYVDLLAVMLVLAVNHLVFLVDFVDIELVVKYEDRSLAGHEKGVVLLQVGTINAEAPPYFSAD